MIQCGILKQNFFKKEYSLFVSCLYIEYHTIERHDKKYRYVDIVVLNENIIVYDWYITLIFQVYSI